MSIDRYGQDIGAHVHPTLLRYLLKLHGTSIAMDSKWTLEKERRMTKFFHATANQRRKKEWYCGVA